MARDSEEKGSINAMRGGRGGERKKERDGREEG